MLYICQGVYDACQVAPPSIPVSTLYTAFIVILIWQVSLMTAKFLP